MISNRSALGSKPALTDSELAEPRGFFLRHSSLTWTHSYFVSTVGGAPRAIVKQYIENQKHV